ncbi:YtzI protein [Bacillus sp. REN3]|uniref:YtzI protein n=1 Tax=Bacillus sp. REN3 TaxID=2802440 RepID=UPI001AED8CBD|nr:YtzI protein [Bacillus sp. REN3]
MYTIVVISVVIVIVVLVLSVLTTSKAYQFKHTVDPLDERLDGTDKMKNNQKQANGKS